MMTISYIFFALFAVASVVHLVHSWQDSPKRAYTKPMLLLFLLAAYCFAADPPLWILIAALATSWLGDVLLMPKGNKWFVMGGISFLISHIFFMFVYLRDIQWASVKWFILLPAALIYYGVSVFLTLSLKKNLPKPMLIPMILYLLFNSTMNLFALARLMTLGTVGSVLAYVGAIFFFISDCTLYLVRYHEKKDLIFKKHFTVMFTYILGECLITVGILMG